jgi:hypothetical protein
MKAPKTRNLEPARRLRVVPEADRPTREELVDSIQPPALTLDDIVITTKHTPVGREKLVLSGAELARVLSLREGYNSIFHMTGDAGETAILLRGMAELLHGRDESIGADGAFFLGHVLDDFAARLEASDRVDHWCVFRRRKGAPGKAVTS